MAYSSTLLQTVAAGAAVALLTSCGGSPASEAEPPSQADHEHVAGTESEFEDIILTADELEAIQLATDTARVRTLASELSAMGRVLANQHRTAIVSYPFTARVARIDVRVGAWVEAGQELVVLQSEEVGAATSEFYKADADFQLAQLDHERETLLFESGVGAQKNSLAAEAALRVAQASLDAAEKKLHVLGFSEEEVTILTDSHQVNPIIALFSPIAGKVVSNNVVLGEMVDESTEILTIMDPRLLWVDAEIYEKDIAKLRTGQNVAISVPAYPNDTFNGSITYISDVLNDDTRTITVRTEVPNADNRLKPGMFASVIIELDTNGGAIAVPVEAVLDDEGARLVFIRTGPRQFEPRHVTTGTREDGFVEIVSGIEVGEEIVTTGNFQLKSKLYEALLEAGHVH
jgi:cobalt-zinc-cadmium efflux system membrane fusion protein